MEVFYIAVNFNKLKNINLIKLLDEKEIKDNLAKGNFVLSSYEKNSIIHIEGEKCNDLEIIVSGKIVVESIDEDGNFLTISDFNNDEVIGGNLVFSERPYYPMTVTAKSKTEILKIDKDTLLKILRANTKFLESFLALLSDNAIILGNKIKLYSRKTIREILLNYLEQEKQIQNSNRIILGSTKKELAEKFGIQRTSLSRELAKMKEDGLIEFDRKSITLI